MKAIVQIPFRGVRDGEHHPSDLKPGDVIDGDLARVALEEGWALPDGKRSPLMPDSNQALGGAPEPFREAPPLAVRRHRKRA